MNRDIRSAYDYVTGGVFNPNSDACRMKMQRVILLLQGLNIPIGKYCFNWGVNGATSYDLYVDMWEQPDVEFDIIGTLRPKDVERVGNVCQMMAEFKNTPYSSDDWADVLAGVYWLRRYDDSLITPNDVFNAFKEVYPKLDNADAFYLAYRLISETYEME